MLLQPCRQLRCSLRIWSVLLQSIAIVLLAAVPAMGVDMCISRSHLEQYFIGTERWSEVAGNEVTIIRGGVQARMDGGGRLLLNDSRGHLPPVPFTVESVTFTWSADSPANYTIQIFEEFPNIIESPILSIPTTGQISQTQQEFHITLPCTLIEGVGVVHVSLMITGTNSLTPIRVKFKLYKDCVDPTNSIAYLVKQLELREAGQAPEGTGVGSGDEEVLFTSSLDLSLKYAPSTSTITPLSFTYSTISLPVSFTHTPTTGTSSPSSTSTTPSLLSSFPYLQSSVTTTTIVIPVETTNILMSSSLLLITSVFPVTSTMTVTSVSDKVSPTTIEVATSSVLGLRTSSVGFSSDAVSIATTIITPTADTSIVTPTLINLTPAASALTSTQHLPVATPVSTSPGSSPAVSTTSASQLDFSAIVSTSLSSFSLSPSHSPSLSSHDLLTPSPSESSAIVPLITITSSALSSFATSSTLPSISSSLFSSISSSSLAVSSSIFPSSSAVSISPSSLVVSISPSSSAVSISPSSSAVSISPSSSAISISPPSSAVSIFPSSSAVSISPSSSAVSIFPSSSAVSILPSSSAVSISPSSSAVSIFPSSSAVSISPSSSAVSISPSSSAVSITPSSSAVSISPSPSAVSIFPPSSTVSISLSSSVVSIFPSSSLAARVPTITPAALSPVRDVIISVVNASAFVVSWMPPLSGESNVVTYSIRVTLYSNTSHTLYWGEESVGVTSHSVVSSQIAGLIPYVVSVSAVFDAGEVLGPSLMRMFFTKQGAPPPVQNVRVVRINGTAASVRWDKIPISIARGILTNYTITLTPEPPSQRRRRQTGSGSITRTVPASQNSVTVTGLDPDLQYLVSVSGSTQGGGMGNSSDQVTAPMVPASSSVPTPTPSNPVTASMVPAFSLVPTLTPPVTPVPVEPWLFYTIIFSPLVGILIVCSIIIILCLLCLKCARMRKSQPEFQDDPYEVTERVLFPAYEEDDDEKSLEAKKEEIPITLWMSLGWGFVSYLLLHVQTMIKTLNVDRRRLTIQEKILRGTYGCLMKGTMLVETFEGLSTNEHVTLKMMIGITDEGNRREEVAKFIEQATLLQGLEHLNVLPVLGLSVEDGVVPIVIYPSTEYGNLQIFMERSRLTPGETMLPPLSIEMKVVFSYQVASAMKFLSDNGIVHPDLGLRNCWLDTNFTVRISDGALSQEFFADCYATIRGSLRPVKWSAIETLQEGLCTTQSNVWSFGVTMWEVMTTANHPYPGIPNRSVLSQLMMEERLEPPQECPANLATMMKNCWRRRAEERPNFTQIYAELEEMNDRYSSFQPTTQQAYLPDSQEPTFSTFIQPPLITTRLQPVATNESLGGSRSEPLGRHLNVNPADQAGGNSEPLYRQFSQWSSARNSRQLSLSFTGLSSGSSSESEDEPAGGGSFPSTLKSRGSTIKAERMAVASESVSTLKPTSTTPQETHRSDSPEENSKTPPFNSSTSARSSILLPATTQSLASTSNTDCSSLSTGLESMNTTISTPTIPPNHLPTSTIELRRIAGRDSLPAPGNSNRSSSSSNPAHSMASVSPQTVATTKSTDSGIRSDEDSSSDSQGHQENHTSEGPRILEEEEDPFKAPSQLETSFSKPKEAGPETSDPFGLGLGDMSSELFAAFDNFSTFK